MPLSLATVFTIISTYHFYTVILFHISLVLCMDQVIEFNNWTELDRMSTISCESSDLHEGAIDRL